LQWSTTDAPTARLSNSEEERMVNTIKQSSKSDSRLAGLLNEAREYAQVYVLARQRQKGCDGMGELATMKEEFRDVVDKVIQYCKEKKYIPLDVSYDTDIIAGEIVKGQDTL
jgi:hypothetical protein